MCVLPLQKHRYTGLIIRKVVVVVVAASVVAVVPVLAVVVFLVATDAVVATVLVPIIVSVIAVIVANLSRKAVCISSDSLPACQRWLWACLPHQNIPSLPPRD